MVSPFVFGCKGITNIFIVQYKVVISIHKSPPPQYTCIQYVMTNKKETRYVTSLPLDTSQERRGTALVSTSGTNRDAHKGRLYPEAGRQLFVVAEKRDAPPARLYGLCMGERVSYITANYFSNSWMARMVMSSSRSKRGKKPSSPRILRTM